MGKVETRDGRLSGIELLRIVSMIGVLVLHYFNLSGYFTVCTGGFGYYAAWLLEAFCYVAVNIFFLISGYFAPSSRFSVKKLLSLLLQVLIYSVGIYLVFCAAGVQSFKLSTFVTAYLFPVTHGSWWFITVYIVMYLFSPFLRAAVDYMSERMHGLLVITWFAVFSLIPTVMFFSGYATGLGGGYSLLWGIYLYFVGAYIAKYRDKIAARIRRSTALLVYIGCSLLTFGGYALQRCIMIAVKGVPVTYWRFYSYTSVTVVIASVALFYFAVSARPFRVRVINWISSGCLAVFLISMHYSLRTELWEWLRVEEHAGGALMLPHMLVSVLGVFVLCVAVELLLAPLRGLVFRIGFIARATESLQARIDALIP